MSEPALPNFFVVGAGKAGTTSLYHYLRQHPQIYMSPVKEPCYFASEIRPENLTPVFQRHVQRMSRDLSKGGDGKSAKPMAWLATEWEDYLELFRDLRDETAAGEGSAAYLWSETAAGNISSCIPEARIIMILRDPSERAFSQYLHQLATGLTRSTFRDHIEKCVHNKDRRLGPHYPLLEVGLYSRQVRRYFDHFPPNNIRIYWYEEAWREPAEFLADLFQFLDVDSTFCADTSHKSLERRAPRFAAMNYALKHFEITRLMSRLTPACLQPRIRRLFFRRGRALAMDSKDRQYLVDYYREDIMKLAGMLNRDLSAWLL